MHIFLSHSYPLYVEFLPMTVVVVVVVVAESVNSKQQQLAALARASERAPHPARQASKQSCQIY